MRLAVIGVGSPWGDDCLAWEVIEQLRLQNPTSDTCAGELVMETYDRPGVMLLESLTGMDHAILVDAVTGSNEPAAWYALEAFACLASPLSAHALGCAETLALGRALGELPPFEILGLRLDAAGSRDPGAVERGLCLLIARLSTLGWPVHPRPELSHPC